MALPPFQWPTVSNIFDSSHPDINIVYYDAVRQYIANKFDWFPPALIAYNDPAVQRDVFRPTMLRTVTTRGLVCDEYYAPLPYYDNGVADRIIAYLRQIMRHMGSVNVSFGFLHTASDVNTVKYKYGSNNTMLLDERALIANLDDLQQMLRPALDEITVHTRMEQVFIKSYKLSIVAILQVGVQVWHSAYPVGCIDFIDDVRHWSQKHVWTFSGRRRRDNMCFWRSLASFLLNRPYRLEQEAKALCRRAVMAHITLINASGKIDIAANVQRLEDEFGVCMRFYDERRRMLNLPYSLQIYNSTARFLLIGEHCMPIRNVHGFAGLYKCHLCNRLFAHQQTLSRHLQGCGGRQRVHNKKISFPGGTERPRLSMFD